MVVRVYPEQARIHARSLRPQSLSAKLKLSRPLITRRDFHAFSSTEASEGTPMPPAELSKPSEP
eukprot:134030-Amorphochlora_amoeboformis.AAC.2